MKRVVFLLPLLMACAPTPTFTADVAPLLDKHCKSCHFEGGIGPFSLLTYADAREHAFDIADEVEEGDMPPFHADNSGACNTFVDAAVLTPKEIKTITEWADGGAPEGAPSTPLLPPVADTLQNPELIVTLAEPYESAKLDQNGLPSADDIRCFIVDTGLTEDLFVTAYEVIADHPEIAHHMVLFRLDDPQAEAQAEELDAAFEVDDSGQLLLDANGQPFNNPGYDCPGDSGIRQGRASTVTAWAPGRNVRGFAPGTGIRFKAGQRLIMQMHYNYGVPTGVARSLSSSEESRFTPYHSDGERPADQSSLAFRMVNAVDFEASMVRFGPLSFEILPGQDNFDITLETPPAPIGTPEILIHAMFPHMHQRAQALRVDIGRAGDAEECALHVPDWDYHWQDMYTYEQALSIGEGDSLHLKCSYRTRGDLSSDFESGAVSFGEETEDEMCFNFFYITCPDFPGGCPQEITASIEGIN